MNPETILIVDDEEMIHKSIKRTLIDEDYTILKATSGTAGLARLEQQAVSLVISDQKMPGMSGLEFLERVKIRYPDTLTIMMTAHADMAVAIHAINKAWIYKFVLKPWESNDLRITIRRALETRRLMLERDSLSQQVKSHEARLADLEKKHPGITKVERDENGYILSID